MSGRMSYMTVSFLEVIARTGRNRPQLRLCSMTCSWLAACSPCLPVSLEPSVPEGSSCLLQGRTVGFDLHVAFRCVCAYLPSFTCVHTHIHTAPVLAPVCTCVLSVSCPSSLSQFIPSALSLYNSLHKVFYTSENFLSLLLFLLQNGLISDPVSHQCWLTAHLYLCCCN